MISRLCIGMPREEAFAALVEKVVRQCFDLIEHRRTQMPAAQLLVFQPCGKILIDEILLARCKTASW